MEFNQPSGKIIQIGAVYVDAKQNEILDEFMCYIDPEEPLGHGIDGKSISDLTGITEETIKNYSNSASVGLFSFLKWMEKHQCRDFVDWGGGDYRCLMNQATFVGIEEKRLQKLRHHNLKSLATLLRSLLPKAAKQRGGLANTIESLGWTFEGKQHDALDDATNTAYILFKISSLIQLGLYCEKETMNNKWLRGPKEVK